MLEEHILERHHELFIIGDLRPTYYLHLISSERSSASLSQWQAPHSLLMLT